MKRYYTRIVLDEFDEVSGEDALASFELAGPPARIRLVDRHLYRTTVKDVPIIGAITLFGDDDDIVLVKRQIARLQRLS